MTKNKTSKENFFNYDIVVGIPSLNESDNIGFVASQVDKGLVKFFSQYKSLIVNADNCSPDGTREAFLATPTKNDKKYLSTPRGVKGKGNNFHNLFKLGDKVGAKALLVVDADLQSITPDWIYRMLTPVFKGYDYVLPLYSRNEYDGTITNFICFPLLYGLLNTNIRQPIAGDFAFSSRLNRHFLGVKWFPNTYQYGIDIFMTMNAVLGGFKIAQVSLGSKIHKPSAPKLGPMFTQVVSTLFKNILLNKKLLPSDPKVKTPPIVFKGKSSPPQALSIDYKSMKKTAVENFQNQEKFLIKHLEKRNYQKIKTLMKNKEMKISRELWTEIVYDLLGAYHKTHYSPAIVEALKCLYFARTASFIKNTLDDDHTESEKKIIKQAKIFHAKRKILIDKLQ